MFFMTLAVEREYDPLRWSSALRTPAEAMAALKNAISWMSERVTFSSVTTVLRPEGQ